MHMPGHKGNSLTGFEGSDITEITGADVLYHAEGIILESENNASKLFSTAKTLYSAEGSSLSMRAMLYLLRMYALSENKKPRIAAARNAHKVFISAAALLDIDIDYLCSKDSSDFISCIITPEELDIYLAACEDTPSAVYITSPDYLGNITDIKGIAAVCRKYGCILMVDNAHGSYLKFLPADIHPISLGADICCDSAHKTLSALTGSAYLHISDSAPQIFSELAEQAMALFASTSPSYLILQSLDKCNAYLSTFAPKLAEAVKVWGDVKTELISAGFTLAGQEPLKLTVLPKLYGYTGRELAEYFEAQSIFCEFADDDHIVMMLPVEFSSALPEKIINAFTGITRRDTISAAPPLFTLPERILSPHDALFCTSEEISISRAEGRIMADPCVSCPPAIPIVIYGERIDASAVEAMKYYGINKVRVLCDK